MILLSVAKTKALISCVVTKQLICAFVFTYAKSRFSLDEAQLMIYCLCEINFSYSFHLVFFSCNPFPVCYRPTVLGRPVRAFSKSFGIWDIDIKSVYFPNYC